MVKLIAQWRQLWSAPLNGPSQFSLVSRSRSLSRRMFTAKPRPFHGLSWSLHGPFNRPFPRPFFASPLGFTPHFPWPFPPLCIAFPLSPSPFPFPSNIKTWNHPGGLARPKR